MITEIVTLHIAAQNKLSFESDFDQASKLLEPQSGYHGHKLLRCVETPNRYQLLIEWETIDDHMKGFRQSAEFSAWQELLGKHYDGERLMEHYETVHERSQGDQA